ncbi:MAG TPA: signal recognition particle-docking protein FtsY [Candidatus Poseidoniales archaeon]|nr:signal recognition particle-docking protein FtsY [Candidatus Poseidoniales archaeon]
MGLFDRFRRRLKEVGSETDIGELTADPSSEEASAAEKDGERRRQEAIGAQTRQRPDVVEDPSPVPLAEDDWDDDLDFTPPSKTRRRRASKESLPPSRPQGSAVDLRTNRSTTGRQLVSVSSAPRGSTHRVDATTSSGQNVLIDLGGGVVSKGGRIVKSGPALDGLIEDLEVVMLEADMSRAAVSDVLGLIKNELIGRRLRKKAPLEKVIEASLIRALRSMLDADYWDFFATVQKFVDDGDAPVVVMLVGVNGTGKTTTCAKLAHHFRQLGLRSVLAAADTFRAAGIDQLAEHAKRLQIRCIASERGGDSAALVRDAIDHAKARRVDVVIVDTAGRMSNKTNLMEELRKVHRVANPHLVLFVGDALAGNDVTEQAVEFQRILQYDGAVLSKLDTDAKGGAALSIAYATGKPIVLAGVGQEYEDLKQFEPDWLLEQLFE